MKGTIDGVPVLVGIVATLLVAVAFVALINAALGELPHWGDAAITLQRIFAWPFRPVMWLIGLPWDEAGTAATLMGTKTVLNEFVAYLNFAALPPDTFAPRSRLILTYALCGFANFGSLGIMIGGLGVMVPERRHEVVALGLRSILSGTLATCMSGAVAGMLAGEGEVNEWTAGDPACPRCAASSPRRIRRRRRRVPRSCVPAATRSMRRRPPPRR